jgi:hypothetical protein
MIEQIFVHKAAIALRMIRRKTDVLIEVDRAHARKIQRARPVRLHEIWVNALRRAAGARPRRASGFL